MITIRFLLASLLLTVVSACGWITETVPRPASPTSGDIIARPTPAQLKDQVPVSTPANLITPQAAKHLSTSDPGLDLQTPNPLTGLLPDRLENLNRRPILVKVSNFPRSNRPQWGLSLADIVFEHYAEGGLTRFSALFYGKDAERIGPIRSARFVDVELVQIYEAIFAYGSGDFRVRNRIAESSFKDRAVSEYPARCPPMCRFDPANFNHLVTSTLDLHAYLSELGVADTRPELEGMTHSLEPPIKGQSAKKIEIQFSREAIALWTYDPGAESYYRAQETGGSPAAFESLLDALTGDLITADNVIILFVPHTYFSTSPEIIEIELHGSGQALMFRDGFAYSGFWERPEGGGVLILKDGQGEALTLKPGISWFELMNTSTEVHGPAEAEWRLRFHIP